MKILNKILIGSLSLLCLSSCDFLDETAYNKVTVGNFYTTKDGITNGVNGLYSTLRGMYIQEYLICVKVLRIYGSVIKDMSNGIIGRLMRQMLMSGVSGIVVINP